MKNRIRKILLCSVVICLMGCQNENQERLHKVLKEIEENTDRQARGYVYLVEEIEKDITTKTWPFQDSINSKADEGWQFFQSITPIKDLSIHMVYRRYRGRVTLTSRGNS